MHKQLIFLNPMSQCSSIKNGGPPAPRALLVPLHRQPVRARPLPADDCCLRGRPIPAVPTLPSLASPQRSLPHDASEIAESHARSFQSTSSVATRNGERRTRLETEASHKSVSESESGAKSTHIASSISSAKHFRRTRHADKSVPLAGDPTRLTTTDASVRTTCTLREGRPP